jgi:uncharacterized protein
MNNSRLVLGTVQFGMTYGINNIGGQPSVQKVFDILDLAATQGIKQLDTADLYGDAQQIIGEYLRNHQVNFVINTKFSVNKGKSIEEQLNQSLESLNLEKINTYFFHRFDEMAKTPQILNQLEDLKERNLIDKIGVSVYSNEEFEHSIKVKKLHVIQIPFNLLDNYSRRGGLIKLAKEKGKEIQVRSIFLQGLFFKDRQSFPVQLQPLIKYINKLDHLSELYEISMNDLAMGYVLKKKEIDFIVIGIDSEEQLKKNLLTEKIQLDDELEKEIDNLFVKEESLLYPFNWS